MHKKITTESDFAKNFLHSMHQVYSLIQKNMEQKLKNAKTISFSQFWVLICFIECREESGQVASEIAKKMYITEASLSRHVSKLEKDKLVTKQKDKQNGRKYIISLTDKGKKQYEVAKKIIDIELKKIFNVVNLNERDIIMNNFEKVLINLKQK